jgi:hypothetical protein
MIELPILKVPLKSRNAWIKEWEQLASTSQSLLYLHICLSYTHTHTHKTKPSQPSFLPGIRTVLANNLKNQPICDSSGIVTP